MLVKQTWKFPNWVEPMAIGKDFLALVAQRSPIPHPPERTLVIARTRRDHVENIVWRVVSPQGRQNGELTCGTQLSELGKVDSEVGLC